MIDLTIDGQGLRVKEGTTILQAAETTGIKIPTLCYHKALSRYGACRICLVEIRRNGRSQIQASCQYQVRPGMVVRTDSEREGHKDQEDNSGIIAGSLSKFKENPGVG